MDITSYLLGKKSGGGSVNNQNKNITITENGTTTATADAGYTGLGTVEITTNVSTGIDEYFTTEITSQNKDNFKSVYIKKFPAITIDSNITDCGNLFQYWPYSTLNVSQLDISNVRNMYGMFSYISNIQNIDVSGLDTSSATNMSNMFAGSNFASLDLSNFNTSNVTDMSNMFSFLGNLQSLDISNFDTSKVTNMANMFSFVYNLQTLDLTSFDTSKVTAINAMFQQASGIKTVLGTLDLSSCGEFQWMFSYASSLENLPTFTNIGKAYHAWVDPHVDSYAFNVADCNNLTHTSLMNIINGLYDIATAGCNTQDLVLGATNLAKLSAAEIAIATDKGWTVS